ncbi:MAG: hypothetical protein BRC43_14375 [Cyanobacteria bacterium QS_3_48_167]|nr:MAG: hypothetical protein BRC43_14375 [Cyanobacteria bacterium QS_3_48_167]
MRDYGIPEIEEKLMMTEKFTEKQAQKFARKVDDAMDNEECPYYTESAKDRKIIKQYEQYLDLLANMGYARPYH